MKIQNVGVDFVSDIETLALIFNVILYRGVFFYPKYISVVQTSSFYFCKIFHYFFLYLVVDIYSIIVKFGSQ
jgi:hypothetical protein